MTSRVVEAKEPDTINYQFYLNRAIQSVFVHETCANSEAVLAHITGVASQTILPKIFSVSRISRFEIRIMHVEPEYFATDYYAFNKRIWPYSCLVRF